MIEAYNAQAKSMADLLSETHQGRVIVSPFQRGYSWGKKHVEASWNDLHNFRNESKGKGGGQPRFGAVPGDELLDGVSVDTARTGRAETVEDRRLGMN